jgi:hypothetical protein
MKTSEIVSNSLSVVAIIVSIFVWRTADTRATEVKDKIVKYSVDTTSDETDDVSSPGGKKGKNSQGLPAEFPPEKTIDKEDVVRVNIWNTGMLPTKNVTLTITTQTVDGKLPPYRVELNPATDYEPVVQGSNLVVRLQNPLGPKSKIEATVTFDTVKNHREAVKGFTPKEAFVDSEMGAAILVASLRGGSSNF